MVTPIQYRTYEFIKTYIQQQGYAPTLIEIAHGIGVRSKSLISRYIHILAKEGFIDIVKEQRRGIRLKKSNSTVRLPLIGRIAAGLPIEAISAVEAVDVIDLLMDPRRKNVFALEVKGDSMVDEGIFNGDIVLCEKRDATVHDGEIVVALVDQQEATLKRFYQHSHKKVMLVPANVSMKPLILNADRVQIQGVFCGLIRLIR